MGSLFDKIAQKALKQNMAFFGENGTLVYPESSKLPAVSNVYAEFDTDMMLSEEDRYSVREQTIVSIFKEDMPKFIPRSRLFIEGREFLLEALHTKSIAGRVSTIDEWVIVVRELGA